MMIEDAATIDEDVGLGQAFASLNEVNAKTAKEITPTEDTTYIVAVGWFEDYEPGSDQYHLKITIE